MGNIDNFLSLIFKDISAQDILDEDYPVKYNRLNNDIILKLMERRISHYSRNEQRNLLSYLEDECTDIRRNYAGIRYSSKQQIKMDAFSILFYYVSGILIIQDNEVCCQYRQFLQWRMLTLQIQEDMLVTSFLADWDCRKQIERKNFGWATVIGHNNNDLNMIMKQGLAENHFHLKGSAPMFHFTWIHLMNELSEEDKNKISKMEKTRRKVSYKVSEKHSEQSWHIQIIQAAIIRLYLFSIINEEHIILDEENFGIIEEERDMYKRQEKQKRTLQKLVEKVLIEPELALIVESMIYRAINNLRTRYISTGDQEKIDYALYDKRMLEGIQSSVKNGNQTQIDLWGERCFLYNMFRAIREETFLDDWCKNIFYAYLVIKEGWRAEFIQQNDAVGFENFSIFEQRKGYFTSDRELISQAMYDTMLSQNIHFLEARICPWDTAEDNVTLIKRLDSFIDPEKKIQDRYCYIMHFVKKEDGDLLQEENGGNPPRCRHKKLREEIESQADGLIRMRERYPIYAKRILGIDACNQEIGCRPEVFACIFRRLTNHTAYEYTVEGIKNIPQLRITYHAGEDFLDLVDGLRAIDEAINYLEMRCGDRLGHALALGVDVEEWYQSKYKIIIPIQDYLDNIVWVYFAMFLYNIPDTENLTVHLQEEYEYYFQKIYRKNMQKEMLDKIRNAAAEYYQNENVSHYYGGSELHFDINNYRKSWMLRGDDPIYYRNGFFRNVEYEDYRIKDYKLGHSFSDIQHVRYIPEAAILNYYYHYNDNVKRDGNVRMEKTIHPAYIRAVKLIQHKMQERLTAQGISIEANPTSNYVIGTFKRYDKHPIISWYNKSLEMDFGKIKNSPQISVSINTDDQGVFATKLENEYALMALALELCKDDENQRKYSRNIVYQWIDDIRKFGLQQNFLARYSNWEER